MNDLRLGVVFIDPLSTIAEFVTTDGMTLSEIYQIRDF